MFLVTSSVLFKLRKVRCFEEMDTKCLVYVDMVDYRPGRSLILKFAWQLFFA
jgi:hypothetical protein